MANGTQRGVYEGDGRGRRCPGSGLWWIDCYQHGVRHNEQGGSYQDACALYHKRKAEGLRAAKLPELAKQEATLNELCNDALAYTRLRHARSERLHRQRIEILKGHFGSNRRASEISKTQIEEFFRSRAQVVKGLSKGKGSGVIVATRPATLNRWRSLLSLIFRLAVESGKLAANPIAKMQRLQEQNLRDRYLTEDEEKRFRAVLAKHYPHRIPEIDIALNTGLRQGSQYGLLWSDVDLDRRVITIRRAKSGKREHKALNDAALHAFRALRSPVIQEMRRALARGTPGKYAADPERVFDLATPRKWFEHALELAGISNFSWHDLRHTVGSRATMQGVPLRAIQELLGHSSIQTTERYSHLAPDYQRSTVEALMQYHTGAAAHRSRPIANGPRAVGDSR
jgi:integrase